MVFEVKAISEGFWWKGDYVERSTPALIYSRTSRANSWFMNLNYFTPEIILLSVKLNKRLERKCFSKYRSLMTPLCSNISFFFLLVDTNQIKSLYSPQGFQSSVLLVLLTFVFLWWFLSANISHWNESSIKFLYKKKLSVTKGMLYCN